MQLAEEPATYYVTDHYLNHPVVLVRMSKLKVDQLQDLLRAAWRFVTDNEKKKAAKRSGAAKARTGKQDQKRRQS